MTKTLHKTRGVVTKARLDSHGVRKAAIALLTALYRSGRHVTLAEALVALEVMDAHLEGEPHTLRSLSDKLGMPYSSVSRVVFGLTSKTAPDGILKLEPHPTGRRRKIIGVDNRVFEKYAAQHLRPMEQAMLDYYGQSVYKLKHKD